VDISAYYSPNLVDIYPQASGYYSPRVVDISPPGWWILEPPAGGYYSPRLVELFARECCDISETCLYSVHLTEFRMVALPVICDELLGMIGGVQVPSL
jgi:hypothetical protein